jgi:hypothetical protein
MERVQIRYRTGRCPPGGCRFLDTGNLNIRSTPLSIHHTLRLYLHLYELEVHTVLVIYQHHTSSQILTLRRCQACLNQLSRTKPTFPMLRKQTLAKVHH